MEGGGFQVGDAGPLGGPHAAYTLTSPGYTPAAFNGLAERFPLPAALCAIAQRPVLSIGRNRTGERDLAHHYHPVTAMRLLQGEKIWALRPPGDLECASNSGSCTDPFDVCAYYARPGAPPPACVQRPGETIVVPDGWYHGTCNNATWTVGLGAQGRQLELTPPVCHHCRIAGQPAYATSEQLLLGEAEAAALAEEATRAARSDGTRDGATTPLHETGRVMQAPLMAFRSLYAQVSPSRASPPRARKTYLSADLPIGSLCGRRCARPRRMPPCATRRATRCGTPRARCRGGCSTGCAAWGMYTCSRCSRARPPSSTSGTEARARRRRARCHRAPQPFGWTTTSIR